MLGPMATTRVVTITVKLFSSNVVVDHDASVDKHKPNLTLNVLIVLREQLYSFDEH